MKTIPFILVILVQIGFSCNSSKKERPSPLRTDSTSLVNGTLKVTYSSPAVNDRVIWGELVPYDVLWRTGANEASYFQCSVPIKLAGQNLDSGSYAIFTIPSQEKWKIILNEHWDQWGVYEYDSTLNVFEVEVFPKRTEEFSERMKFTFEDHSLKFQWEYLMFNLPIE